MTPTLREQLFHEILMARQRVYTICQPTPLQRINAPIDAEVYVKREDVSPIHAYKWRGAYNRMALLLPAEREVGVVAASAGNHAQGVALAAARLGTHATIFMPKSTPKMKQVAVAHHGGSSVDIVLHGDSYDDAANAGQAYAREHSRAYIHAYDDLATMGGQGTMADEIVMSGKGPFDYAFLQIGGGGMAAAVACWLKAYYPAIRIIGVEGVEQASMAAAFQAHHPVCLDYVDVFCDGTAVKKAGALTYQLCHELLDELITVTNDEVCAAIQVLWECTRRIPEPAGAMGLAGAIKMADAIRGKRVVTILCGANMDFGQLGVIARQAGIGAHRRHFLRFEISERTGSMLGLMQAALDGVNIVEFQYGKIDPERAWPVIGFEATAPEMELIERKLTEHGIPHQDVTSQEDVEFRIIPYEAALIQNPYYIKLEFPERAGALHDFLTAIRGKANLVYFNYSNTGERVGRAMLGFEFEDQTARESFRQFLEETGRTYREVSIEAMRRIMQLS